MVGLQTLDLAIGVRVPASQPNKINNLRAARKSSRPFCVRGVTEPLTDYFWIVIRSKQNVAQLCRQPRSNWER
jgi:hypothetical protein